MNAREDDLDAAAVGALHLAIAFVAAFDLVALAAMIVGGASSHRRWPGGLGALADRPTAIVAVAIVGLVAVGFFVRRPTHARWPLLAIVATAILHDVVGRVLGVFHETFYHAGAALLGWAAGIGWARALSADETATRRFAARCALAAFAATYVCAGIAKLRDAGLGWADADSLRLVILAHLPVDAHGLADHFKAWVVEHPRVAQSFGVGALVVELGAWTMLLGARWRRATASLLLAFHVGTFLSMRVFFLEASLLLVAAIVPWSRVLRSRASIVDESGKEETSARRVARVGTAVACALAVIVLAVSAVPSLPRAHPIEARAGTASATTSAIASASSNVVAYVIPPGREPQLLALVAPRKLGDEVADGFVLDDLSVAATSFTFRLRRKDEIATVTVAIDPSTPTRATVTASPEPTTDAGRAAAVLRDVVARAIEGSVLSQVVTRAAAP